MERFIANPTASPPQFRISKPGKSVTSIDLDDYLINEQFSTVSAIAGKPASKGFFGNIGSFFSHLFGF